MHLTTGLRALVAVCVLLHGQHALLIISPEKEVDICARQISSGFKILGSDLEQIHQTCSSDLCHEENTENYNLHNQLKKSNQYLMEGDILCQRQHHFLSSGLRVVAKQTKLWEPKIKYKIEDTFNDMQKGEIRAALMKVQNAVQQDTKSCDFSLTEQERITDDQHILFKKGEGYYTAVGKQAMKNVPHNITIKDHIVAGSVMHELMHALGFWHEHARPDRNDYIIVKYENVLQKQDSNFYKLSDDQVKRSYKDIKYDPCSILHYGPKAFSKSEDKDTIVLKDGRSEESKCMGQRKGLTAKDVKRIQLMFKCATKKR